MRAGALAIGILVCAGLAQQANATTITQTVTNSASISVDQLTYDPVQIAPDSFYDATFLPFVGAGLSSAIYSFNYTFSGTANTAPGHTDFDIAINGDSYLDGYDLESIGEVIPYSSDTASVVPFNVSVGDSIDILGTDPDLISYVMGSNPFTFTYPSDRYITLQRGPVGPQLSGTITATAALTYTFDGDGALLGVAVPEPASFALFGTGLLAMLGMRRRRT